MSIFVEARSSRGRRLLRRAACAAFASIVLSMPDDAVAEFRQKSVDGVLVVLEGPQGAVAEVTSALVSRTSLSPASAPQVLFDVSVDSLDQCPDPRAAFSLGSAVRRVLRIPSNSAALASGRNGWDQAWDRLAAQQSTASSLGAALSLRPDVRIAAVEPDIVWEDDDADSELWVGNSESAGVAEDTHDVSAAADDRWPLPDSTDWARKSSQLDIGLHKVESKLPSANGLVRIAHFDTGFTPCQDAGLPPKLLREASYDFTRSRCDTSGVCEPGPNPVDAPQGRINSRGHGTGTLSILAGGPVQYTHGGRPVQGALGGAPFAEVAEYRLTDFVVLWKPSVVADALHWAADHGADVVSMSLGGPPSLTMHSAVNYAYCHGVAVFAAAGNNVHSPWLLFSTPRTTVFPARYDRVISVGGVTHDKLTYARSPWRWRYLLHPFQGVMRGNVGPKSIMQETLTAWTPNVPWLTFREACDSRPAIRLNGSGTSAATPQAAAAAAQWLQYYRDDPALNSNWRTWKKTEAVYHALLGAADDDTPDRGYSDEWFGAGILRAAKAIDDYPPSLDSLTIRPRARLRWDWLASTLASMLGSPSPAALGPARSSAEDMLRTEIAQLAIAVPELREVLDAAEAGDPGAASGERRELLTLLSSEEQASQKLRGLAAEALRAEDAR